MLLEIGTRLYIIWNICCAAMIRRQRSVGTLLPRSAGSIRGRRSASLHGSKRTMPTVCILRRSICPKLTGGFSSKRKHLFLK